MDLSKIGLAAAMLKLCYVTGKSHISIIFAELAGGLCELRHIEGNSACHPLTFGSNVI